MPKKYSAKTYVEKRDASDFVETLMPKFVSEGTELVPEAKGFQKERTEERMFERSDSPISQLWQVGGSHDLSRNPSSEPHDFGMVGPNTKFLTKGSKAVQDRARQTGEEEALKLLKEFGLEKLIDDATKRKLDDDERERTRIKRVIASATPTGDVEAPKKRYPKNKGR